MKRKVVVKSDLVNQINAKVGLNHREAKDFLENFFEQVRSTLESHEDVKISNFGRFCVIHKYARPGRNPKTGVDADISERTVVTFRASNKFRSTIHGSEVIKKKLSQMP